MHYVCRFRQRAECHTQRHKLTVFAAKVAVNPHCERAAVTVPKPFADAGNVNSSFNAKRGEQVPQRMVREPGATNNFTSSCQCTLTFKHATDVVLGLGLKLRVQLDQKLTHCRHKWNDTRAHFVTCGATFKAMNGQLGVFPIHVLPKCLLRFADAATAKREKTNQVRTIPRLCRAAGSNRVHQLIELVGGGQIQLFARYTASFDLVSRVCVSPKPGQRKNLAQDVERIIEELRRVCVGVTLRPRLAIGFGDGVRALVVQARP